MLKEFSYMLEEQKKIEFWAVRHGETEENRLGIIHSLFHVILFFSVI